MITRKFKIFLLLILQVFLQFKFSAQVGTLTGWGMAICAQYSFNICPNQNIIPLNYGNQYFVCNSNTADDVSFINMGNLWRVQKYNWTFISSGGGAQISGVNPSNAVITHSFNAGDILSPGNYFSISNVNYMTFNLNNVPIPGFTVAVSNFTIQVFSATVTVSSASICAGQSAVLTASGALTYSWIPVFLVGHSITVSPNSTTAYTVGGLNGACPSNTALAYVYVTPLPTVSIVSSATQICSGQTVTLTAGGASSYTWLNTNSNGTQLQNSPLASTVYTVIGANGSCADTAFITITVVNSSTPTVSASSASICSGASVTLSASGSSNFIWNPGNLTGSSITVSPVVTTTYTISSVNPVCSGTTQLTIEVTNTPTLSVAASSTLLCTGDVVQLTVAASHPFTWQNPGISGSPVTTAPAITTTYVVNSINGSCSASQSIVVIVSQVPTLALLVTSLSVCENDSAVLGVSGANNYNWMPGSFPTNTIVISPSISVVYTVTGYNNSCFAIKHVTVNVKPAPKPFLIAPAPLCAAQVLSMSVLNILQSNVLWTGPNGFSSTLPSFTTNAVSNLNGIWHVAVTGTNGCVARLKTNVVIHLIPTLIVSDATVCAAETATLGVSGAAEYRWYTKDGTFAGATNQLTVNSSVVGQLSYTVVGYSDASCSATAVGLVDVLELPTPSLTVFPQGKVCPGSSVVLTGAGGNTYYWKGPGKIVSSFNSATVTPGGFFGSGFYTLTVVDGNGCFKSISTLIATEELPQAWLIGQFQGCVPFCSEYETGKSQVQNSNIISQWTINGKIHQSENFKFCTTEPGIHIINGQFRDLNTGCVNSATFSVQLHSKPKAGFHSFPDEPVEGQETVEFYNTSEGEEQVEWTWHLPGDRSLYNGQKFFHHYPNEGIYTVAFVVKNKWGCADTMIKTIRINSEFFVYVPNAFTPNADTKNDVFRAVTRGVKLFKMSIYNRWGEKLFETSDLSDGWDGTYEGHLCKDDVYVWQISVSGNDGTKKDLTGHLSLIK